MQQQVSVAEQLVTLALPPSSLPPINASNAGRRQWLSYFGISTVKGHDCCMVLGWL